MKRKRFWLAVSTLVAIPLIAAAAGEKAEMVKIKATKLDGTVAEKLVEKPRYGGTFNMCQTTDPGRFDEAYGHQYRAKTMYQTNESLLQGDWARGPAGTHETTWFYLTFPSRDLLSGCLAESWEVVLPDTVVYHIRKGVRFHDKPPVNGREMDAHDVVYSLKRLWDIKTSYQYSAYPWKKHFQELDAGPWIQATDKWTMVIKCLSPGDLGIIFEHVSTHTFVIPREVIEKYGDINDWKNSCGTGPFMLTDYVSGSSVTFARNPNYWMKDPLQPSNNLPYLDGVRYIIIPDHSTRLAALRTGKIDWIGSLGPIISWEDRESLQKSSPELQWAEFPNGKPSAISFRVDNPELPWHDKRVRHALCLAVDNQAILKSYYGGHAAILSFPIPPVPGFLDMYTPLEELPESSRQLYEHHPEKARRLLAEAGYPNGFTAEIICTPDAVDMVSIIKAYWAEIGIDLKVDVKEPGVYSSITGAKAQKQMSWHGGLDCVIPFKLTHTVPRFFQNLSRVDDPHINEVAAAMDASYWEEAKRRQLVKDLALYITDQAYYLVPPAGFMYTGWQPWVKNYHGEMLVGYMSSWDNFPRFIWIDEALKSKMTGGR